VTCTLVLLSVENISANLLREINRE